MKVTLYMAISADGFIATKDGNSDWVSEKDSQNFENKIKEKGCIVVGHRTFDQYQGDIFPVKDALNIVLTLTNKNQRAAENVIYTNSPVQALQVASDKGLKEILLVGGGTTNGNFFKDNLIDEIFLTVHPLFLGSGIKLFEGAEKKLDIVFLDQTELGEGLVQLHYKVLK